VIRRLAVTLRLWPEIKEAEQISQEKPVLVNSGITGDSITEVNQCLPECHEIHRQLACSDGRVEVPRRCIDQYTGKSQHLEQRGEAFGKDVFPYRL